MKTKRVIGLTSLGRTFCLCAVGIFLLSCTSDVSGPDRAPVARAGSDITAPIGTQLTLDGSGSFDPDGTAIDAYAWVLNSAPEGAGTNILDGVDTATASITPDVPGTYVISLVVSSNGLKSSPDVLRVLAEGCFANSDCDDENVCNGIETCSNGRCEDGTAVECDDGKECTTDSCDPSSGCQVENLEDGTACGEHFCSGVNLMQHKCLAGECSDSETLQICDDGNPCTDDQCDETQDGCVFTNNTASCDDGDPCSDLDQCIDGTCTAGSVNKDTDGDGYIDAACSGGNDCDDSDFNTNPGAFEGPQNSEVCADEIDNDCDGSTDLDDSGCGYCDLDSDCDDGNACNGSESCTGHACQAGTALNCEDSNECTQDQCDPQAGCVYTDIGDGTECGSRLCAGANGTTWTREVCQGGLCTGTAIEQECDDGNDCTNDSCNPANGCFNPNFDNGTECGSRSCDGNSWNRQVCQDGSCTGTQLAENCDDGNECTNDLCDANSGCSNPNFDDGTDCGSDFCNGTDWNKHVCQSGSCTGSELIQDCDEGVECVDYACDDAAGCSSSNNTGDTCGSIECQGLQWVSYSCNDGQCTTVNLIQDCDDSTLCTDDSCDDVNGCDHSNAAPGTPCEPDSIGCTSDVCDAGGLCTHQEDDSNCDNGSDLCRPTCFANSADGCAAPPGSLVVSCTPNPVDLSSQDNTSCTLTLAGGGTITGQVPCLDCRAELKVVTLDYTDFTDDSDSNSCSLDGWDLVSGQHCFGQGDRCPMNQQSQRDCCENLNCTISGGALDGEHAFVANKADCSDEQWQLRKMFDTRGLQDLELCFDYASRDVTSNEAIQITLNDGINLEPNLFCDLEGPRKEIDDRWYRTCVSLPVWASDNENLMVHIFLQSNDNDDILYLDNINLRGLSEQCPATRDTLVHEDFSGCDDPMIDWNGWTVTNISGSISCDTDDWDCFDNSKRAIANTATVVSFSQTIDLTNYHDVMLCFYYGEDAASIAENLLVEYDLGYGDGWKTIWMQNANAGVNKTCGQICVNLSELNPSTNRDPHFGLRFSMTSGTKKIELDEITLRASQYCDGQGVISFTNQASILPDGQYSYSAQNEYPDMQASADFFCSWDSPPEGQEVQDDTSVDYLFPFP